MIAVLRSLARNVSTPVSNSTIKGDVKNNFDEEISIATAILELSPEDLLKDLNLFGFLFECMCIRDLKKRLIRKNAENLHF